MIHYPHFSTVEIHKDYVDWYAYNFDHVLQLLTAPSILWYNDLILSSAAGEGIQLWKIDNFNADHPPPNPAPIPLSTVVNSCTKVTIPTSSTSGTRSAWGGRFQRLLKFDLKESPYVYSRFGFFHELGTHPILVANSDRSKIRIWDLQHLEGLGAGVEQQPSSKIDKNSKDHLFRQVRENSAMSTASGTSAGQSATTSSTLTHGRRKATKKELEHGISTPFHAVPEQSLITIKNYKEWYRQFAWSRDGQWCVGVGTESLITVLRRWEHGVPPPETGRDGVES
jgi:polycomb protein EED